MESVKMSIDERAKHKEVLVDTESSGTSFKEKDTSSSSGNDAHADDAGYKSQYMRKRHWMRYKTAESMSFAYRTNSNTEQPYSNNEGEVDQNAKQCHDTCPLPATLTDNPDK
ncbi:hypothetical protein Tco_0442051 [Tanacetum coccineum]